MEQANQKNETPPIVTLTKPEITKLRRNAIVKSMLTDCIKRSNCDAKSIAIYKRFLDIHGVAYKDEDFIASQT